METLYWVHWYSNGFCYRSTHSVPKSEIKNLRKLAKQLGETIEIERMQIMKKVALLVKASVMTRVVVNVDDNFNEDTDAIPMGSWEDAVRVAIPRLKENINDFDCIEEVDVDYEMPYDAEYDKEWD